MAAAVAVAALSGCGGSSGDPVADAAKKTLAKHSARVQFRTAAQHATGSYQSIGGNGPGVVDFDRNRLRLGNEEAGAYEITDGPVLYLRAAGDTWHRSIGAKDLRRLYGAGDGYQPLVALIHGHRRPARLGEDSIGGRPATHYRKRVGPRAYPVDVWVDDRGLIRQYRTTSKTSVADFVTTVRFDDFGTPVHITLPPPGKVQAITNGGR